MPSARFTDGLRKPSVPRIARPKKSVRQLQGLFRVLKRIPMIFTVPTTAGTGSETTIAAVVTDSKTHHKASINDISLMPKFAVLDPELTVGLPPKVTATTGMDALCHAVEAYTNNTYNTKLEKDLCRKAVRLIYDNLYKVYKDGTNLEARQNMQRAAFYAGRAFTRGSVGYVHATDIHSAAFTEPLTVLPCPFYFRLSCADMAAQPISVSLNFATSAILNPKTAPMHQKLKLLSSGWRT